MPAHLHMTDWMAIDLLVGRAVNTDIIASQEHPGQLLLGNQEMQRRAALAAGDEGSSSQDHGLLDASDEEVMRWMAEGIEGITLGSSETGVDLGLLDIGPDTNHAELQADADNGTHLLTSELIQQTMAGDRPLNVARIEECAPGTSEQQATSEAGECWNIDYSGRFMSLWDPIVSHFNEIVGKFERDINDLTEPLKRQDLAVEGSREFGEQIEDAIVSTMTSGLGKMMSSLLGGASRLFKDPVTAPAGDVLVSVLETFIKQPIIDGVQKGLASGRNHAENNETVGERFIEVFLRDYVDGVHDTWFERLNFARTVTEDELRSLDACMQVMHAKRESFGLHMKMSALDAFLRTGAESTIQSRRVTEGGDIGSEIYNLEVKPMLQFQKIGNGGFLGLKLPEAIPPEFRAEYAAHTTLRSRWLILGKEYLGGDLSQLEFNTETCEVRGVARRDPRTLMGGALWPLVERYLPTEYDRFCDLIDGNMHPPGDVANISRVYRPFTNSAEDVQELCEEAVRLWFMDGVDRVGGVDIPVAKMACYQRGV